MSAAKTGRGSIDRSLSRYLSREVYPNAPGARQRLDEARIGGGGLRTLADLKALEAMSLDDAADGSGFLLRPTRDAVMRNGSGRAVARLSWAGSWGRWSTYMRRSFEPRYRPVHFFDAAGVPVGASVRDLVRLSALGARWLGAVGVSEPDTAVLVGGAGGGVEAWELSSATRRTGVALAVVDHPSAAARLRPTVLFGGDAALSDALDGGGWPELRLAVVLGRSAAATHQRVAGHLEVRRAWAPPGVRAAWFECLGGAAMGWHTNPGAEVLEVEEHSGEVLWTALGWSGTVFLRLRTDLRAHLERGACPACGAAGPRLIDLAGSPTLGRFLAADARVAEFRLTDAGADVLPVRPGKNLKLQAEAASTVAGSVVRILAKRAWNAGDTA